MGGELNGRWTGVERPYTRDDVERIRGRFQIEHTLARLGAERLWKLLHSEDYVAALGAMTGAQGVQMVKAGLQAIYVSGWQVAADANLAGHTYPDQSLYPATSAPASMNAFISSKALSGPPNPASASATIGTSHSGASAVSSAQVIWSARSSALLMRRTTDGTEFAG